MHNFQVRYFQANLASQLSSVSTFVIYCTKGLEHIPMSGLRSKAATAHMEESTTSVQPLALPQQQVFGKPSVDGKIAAPAGAAVAAAAAAGTAATEDSKGSSGAYQC